MNATDTHYCQTYNCKLTVAACASRHANANCKIPGMARYRAGVTDINCRKCETGRRHLADLKNSGLRDYKNGLRDVRKRARDRHFNGFSGDDAAAAPQLPKEEPMTQTNEQAHTATKVCKRKGCKHGGKPQPLGDFDNRKWAKDGKTPFCKDCRRQYQRDLRARKNQKSAPKKAAPDNKTRSKPSAAASSPEQCPESFGRLAAALTAGRCFDRDALIEIRDQCGKVFEQIDTYLTLHAMFSGGDLQEVRDGD